MKQNMKKKYLINLKENKNRTEGIKINKNRYGSQTAR